jgi:uncharacterized membrane protein
MPNLAFDVLIALLSICLYVLWVFCLVRIFKKAGLGYWGLCSIVPIMALVLLMVLAFAEWPIAEKAKQPIGGPNPL